MRQKCCNLEEKCLEYLQEETVREKMEKKNIMNIAFLHVCLVRWFEAFLTNFCASFLVSFPHRIREGSTVHHFT